MFTHHTLVLETYDGIRQISIKGINKCLNFFPLNSFFKKIFIYLFGCIRSQLRHAGSSLRHAGSFVVVCGLLSSCGTWALQLQCVGYRVHGFSSCSTWALQLWPTGPRAHRLRSCSMWVQQSCSMWDLSSLTRDRTRVPCIGKQILNWTTREVPSFLLILTENTGNDMGHNFPVPPCLCTCRSFCQDCIFPLA